MPRWVRLATLDELPQGRTLERAHEGRVVALFNADGTVRAVDGMCPHQGGPLAEGERSGDVVTCPWHGWRFDLRDGRCMTGRVDPLPVYEVRIEGRDVLVALP